MGDHHYQSVPIEGGECGHCGLGPLVENEEGSIVCDMCGTVSIERGIDLTHEGRALQSESGEYLFESLLKIFFSLPLSSQ